MDKSWISPQMKSFLTFQTSDRSKYIFGVMKKWKKYVLLSIFIVLYICLELVNLAGLELAVARPNLSSNKSTLNRRSPLEGCLMRTALCVDMVSEAAYNIGFVKGGILSLPAPLHYAASIRKSGPEIKNRCTLEGVNRQNLASIRKSGLEIKNRCTQEGVNRQNLASIPKFGPEIKNRCTLEEESGQETLEGVNTDNVFIQWNGNDKRKRV